MILLIYRHDEPYFLIANRRYFTRLQDSSQCRCVTQITHIVYIGVSMVNESKMNNIEAK